MKLIESIEKIICEGQQVTLDQVRQNTRKGEIVFARQLLMYFTWLTKCGTQEEIGSRYAGRDHATVVHAVKMINNYIETDKHKAKLIGEYHNAIGGVISVLFELEILKEAITPIKTEIEELKDKALLIQSLSNNIENKIGEYMSKIELAEEKIIGIVRRINEFCKYNN